MSTTSLFAELLVIGAGALVWLVLLLLAILGIPTKDGVLLTMLSQYESLAAIALVPVMALTYVLGIIMDRFADWSFGFVAAHYNKKEDFFEFKTKDDAREAKTFIYEKSPSLREVFEYGRSRLRVCRGWAVNGLFIAISGVAFTLFKCQDHPSQGGLIIMFVGVFGLLTLAAFLAWRKLLKSESSRLNDQHEQLKKMLAQASEKAPEAQASVS